MSFLDKTFCASPNCKNECGRKMAEEEQLLLETILEWERFISWAYFCGEPKHEPI